MAGSVRDRHDRRAPAACEGLQQREDVRAGAGAECAGCRWARRRTGSQGRPTKARAIATRWRSPARELHRRAVRRCSSPTAASASRARTRRSPGATSAWGESGRPLSSAVIPSSRKNCWNANPIERAQQRGQSALRRGPPCSRPHCTSPDDGALQRAHHVPTTSSCRNRTGRDRHRFALVHRERHAAQRLDRRPGTRPNLDELQRRSSRGHNLQALAHALRPRPRPCRRLQPGLDRQFAPVGQLERVAAALAGEERFHRHRQRALGLQMAMLSLVQVQVLLTLTTTGASLRSSSGRKAWSTRTAPKTLVS